MSDDFAVEIGNGKVLILNEYKGAWKIINGYQGKDGNNYFEMTFPRDRNKQPREVAIPMGVSLGDTKQARAILTQILAALPNAPGGQNRGAALAPQGEDDSQIPF